MDGEKSVVQDEKVLKAKSGYAMLLLGIIGMLLGVAVIIAGCMVFGQTGETNTALLAGSIILGGRPIALLVQEASQYASKVYIQVDNKKINAKSIMGMMSLALQEGDEVTVVAEGEDEEKAAEGIKTFLKKTK